MGGKGINSDHTRRDARLDRNYWGANTTTGSTHSVSRRRSNGVWTTRITPVQRNTGSRADLFRCLRRREPPVLCYYDGLKSPRPTSRLLPRRRTAIPIPQTIGGSGNTRHSKSLAVLREDPVNAATAASHTRRPPVIAGNRIAFAFTRSYNSLDPTTGTLGQGWQHSHGAALTIEANGDISGRMEDGQQFKYLLQTDGSFSPPPGALSTLASVTGGHELTSNDQVKYRFDSQGLLTSVKDRHNQGLSYAYDGNGRLQTITDAASRQITLAYNGTGNLTSVATPDGRSVAYGYTSGRLTSVTDAVGKLWTYTYESHGLLEKEIDPLSRTIFRNVYGQDGRVLEQYDALNNKTSFAWDYVTQTSTITDARTNVWKDVFAGNVPTKSIDALANETLFGHGSALDQTSVTGPTGQATTMSYDARGNLTEAIAPASLQSATKTLAYDASNSLTSVVDARGKVTSYGYDPAGNNNTITQDGHTVATYTHDTAGRVLTSTDGRGNSTGHTYDANGNPASVTDPLGNKTTYTYDSAGRMTSRVDPLGNVAGGTPASYAWTWNYDPAGRVLIESDPLGNTTTSTYDNAGNKLTEKDANNKTTTSAYDAANRLTSMTAPDGGVTSYTYDAVGNKLTETDPRNNTVTSTYDANNRLASVTTPLGNKTTYFYDADGNQTKTVEPRGNVAGATPDDYATVSTYDAAGRQLTETNPLGQTTNYTYDKVGNRTSVTNAKSNTTNYTYDGLNRLSSVMAPGGVVTEYGYDGNGNLLTRTDAKGHVTSYAYDAANRPTQTTLPLNRIWTYTFDANSNLKSIVDANGNATQTVGDGTTTKGYDRSGRLITIDYSDATQDVTFGYDSVGNRTSMSDAAGVETRNYDASNRVTKVTRSSESFDYVYDLVGNITRRTYPDATVVDYSYDQDGLLGTVTRAGGTTTYGYDQSGHETTMTLPASNGYVEDRTYNRAGQLTRVRSLRGAAALVDLTYTVDATGNPTEVIRSGTMPGSTTYTYDVHDRVTEVCYAATCSGATDYIRWSYDLVGNRTAETRPSGTTTYVYDTADQAATIGATAQTYDFNGNHTGGGGTCYAYDAANRLVSASNGSATWAYSFDGDGKRTSVFSGGIETKYVWDPSYPVPELALEQDNAGTVLHSHIYGANRISRDVDSTTQYYHHDALESVVAVSSATGTTDWVYDYEPFGSPVPPTRSIRALSQTQ